MQNCLGKLNFIYCLIYLENIIIFLQMVEEHLHRLHVVFDWFREYNLELKLSKCSLFKEEINYLAHWVYKEGVWPSDSNLRAITKCALPQTYMEILAFLGLVCHYQQFIKGFACIAQLLNGLLSGEGASRKWNGCYYWKMLWEPLMLWNRHAWAPQSLPLPIIPKNSTRILEIDASKEGLGAEVYKKQADGQYHPIAYVSWALMAHEKNYTIPPN